MQMQKCVSHSLCGACVGAEGSQQSAYLHIAGMASELLEHLATLETMNTYAAIIRTTQHLSYNNKSCCP